MKETIINLIQTFYATFAYSFNMLNKSKYAEKNDINCDNNEIESAQKEKEKYYFIGIGGISMSALAKLLKSRGFEVFGSDAVLSNITDELKSIGINVKKGYCESFVRQCDVVVVTGAIGEDNRDLVLARKLGKRIISRAELLGLVTRKNKLISVAGTHGKTTTTGMISSILLESELDPTIHIGGILNNIQSNLYIGNSEYFVSEACEYKDSFLSLKNYIAVILNVEEDHLDYFKNLDNIFRSFSKFAENTDKNGFVIYNYDDYDERLVINGNKLSFGIGENADVQARNISQGDNGKFQFDLFFKGEFINRIYLSCFGRHNIYNALAAGAVALSLGIRGDYIKKGILNFQGVKRRNEIIREEDEKIIIHDYAHHPQEIKATLGAYRQIKKDGKIIAIFQPHTFTRTRDLFEEFVHAFENADEVWLLPIYAAREKRIKGITSFALARHIKTAGKRTRYFKDFSSCKDEILRRKDIDIFAILGAGDIEKLAYSLKV